MNQAIYVSSSSAPLYKKLCLYIILPCIAVVSVLIVDIDVDSDTISKKE